MRARQMKIYTINSTDSANVAITERERLPDGSWHPNCDGSTVAFEGGLGPQGPWPIVAEGRSMLKVHRSVRRGLYVVIAAGAGVSGLYGPGLHASMSPGKQALKVRAPKLADARQEPVRAVPA